MSVKSTFNNLTNKAKTMIANYHLFLVSRRDNTVSDHRSDGFFHPSAICSMCARMLVFPYVKDPRTNMFYKPIKTGDAVLELIFQNGTFGHIRTQLNLVQMSLGMLPMDMPTPFVVLQRKPIPAKIRKEFEDLFEQYSHEPAVPMSRLWALSLEYFFIEYAILDAADNVKGHCDAIILTPRGVFVFEFKTWNSFSWAKLSNEETSHLVQSQTYVRYCNRQLKMTRVWAESLHGQRALTVSGVKGSLFWYENKDNQGMKEYIVLSDEEVEKRIVSLVMLARKYLTMKSLPPQEWKNKGTKPCSQCDFNSYCYRKGGC